jgi:hypothetical protein
MPCTLVCLSPVIIAAWPVISASIVAAAASLRLRTTESIRQKSAASLIEAAAKQDSSVDVELKGSAVLEGYTGQEHRFTHGKATISVMKNDFGRIVVRAEGDELRSVLRQKAETFAREMQQVYSYSRAMTQLRASGFNLVTEEVTKYKEIHILLRRS